MNKEEMQDIKERLELFPDNMNKEAQEGYYKLFDYINQLQQENKQLKDNWNKLKEFINLGYYDSYMYSSTIINKMQEIEKSDDK